MHKPSRVKAVQHPREGDRFPDMIQSANPGHRPLQSQSETGMGNGAVPPQVQIPLIGIPGELMFRKPLLEELRIVDALTAADNLAVSLRRDLIRTQNPLGSR